MKKLGKNMLWILLITAGSMLISSHTTEKDAVDTNSKHALTLSSHASLYQRLHLDGLGLAHSAFDQAIKGYERLRKSGKVSKDIIAICDFSQSSNNPRFYVLDVQNSRILFNTLVAHGKNSGEEFARYFSNRPESLQSSLGFFSTRETYQGKHGLSLRLHGLEPGINDKAEERAIVMHGADYVSSGFSSEHGRLGRSFGCPAVPYGEHEKIINTLKDGSCLFIYHPDKNYQLASALIR